MRFYNCERRKFSLYKVCIYNDENAKLFTCDLTINIKYSIKHLLIREKSIKKFEISFILLIIP